MADVSRNPREHWLKPLFSRNEVAKSGYTIISHNPTTRTPRWVANHPLSYGNAVQSRSKDRLLPYLGTETNEEEDDILLRGRSLPLLESFAVLPNGSDLPDSDERAPARQHLKIKSHNRCAIC